MALFRGSVGGAVIWFALPRFREGEFEGVFTIPVEEAPPLDAETKVYAEGRYWLVHIGQKNDFRPPPT